MTRSEYYKDLKGLARHVRQEHGLGSPRVALSDLRRIYKHYGIRIDYWDQPLRDLRGAFFCDELGCSVMIAKKLPNDPKIFTLAHELKHYLRDRDLPLSICDASNQGSHVEIGAEVFGAEMIFPEEDYLNRLTAMGIQQGGLRPEHLVRLKRETGTALSYAGLAKRAAFFQLCSAESLAQVKWKKLEEAMFGEPLYKKIMRLRAQRERRSPQFFLGNIS